MVKTISRKGWPRRYAMMCLLLVALLLCYVDRVLISVAGIQMQRELGWSDSDKGLVFSVFFLGYLCMQMLGGILSNRYGGRNVFLLAVLGWSLLTMLTPAAAYAGFALLLVARFLLGFGEGAAYPSAYNLIYGWMPSGEVSRSVSMISAAAAVGTIFALLVVGKLIELWGWPAVFYIFGGLGIVWCIFWYLLVPTTPASSLETTDEAASTSSEKDPVPWKQLLPRGTVIPLYAVFTVFGIISYTIASWLPSYFVDTFGLSLTGAGTYSMAPWIANAVVTVYAGGVADRWLTNGADRLAVRKKMVALGMAGAALGCLLITVSSNALSAVLAVSLAFGALGFAVPGFVPVAGELFPRHGDIVYGFLAGTSSVFSSGVVALTGIALDKTGSYGLIFILMGVLSVLVMIVFQLFGSVTPVLAADRQAHGHLRQCQAV